MAIEILKKLITYKTITPKEEGIFDYICSLLNGFEMFRFDTNGVSNLFLYKRFGSGLHLCFNGHVDVVPPGDGWLSDPFVPVQKEGLLYGRGTQDMKGGVACFVKALQDLKSFNGAVSILLTSDEEGDGIYGTDFALKALQKLALLPDVAIVAEPTCENVFGDAIKVGRRGSINGFLEINGKSGHAAYPEKCINPLSAEFGLFLHKTSGKNLDNGDEFFAPSTLVLTDLKAGYGVTNLTPGVLKLSFNLRNSTKTSKEDLADFLHKTLQETGVKNYKLELKQGSFPFVLNSSERSKLLQKNLEKSIEKIAKISPKKSTAGGTSDARFFPNYGVDVLEFGVINSTIHSPNERVSLQEIKDLELVFKDFLARF